MAQWRGTTTLRAVAFSHLVQSRELDWATPMSDLLKDPASGDFVWRRLQYVFRLADPRDFKPSIAGFTEDERGLLGRFVEQAHRLAASSLMASEDIVRISIPGHEGAEDISTDFSDADVTTGFMVFLRQCYADDEEASFSKVRKVIERRLHEAGDENALVTLKAWQKAHARLKNQALEELVQEQLIANGKMPGELEGPDGEMHSSVVRAPASPAEMLLTFWYGDQLHWGKNRDSLAVILADPFDAAVWDISARQAALDLAHFYLGVALLVQSVIDVKDQQ